MFMIIFNHLLIIYLQLIVIKIQHYMKQMKIDGHFTIVYINIEVVVLKFHYFLIY